MQKWNKEVFGKCQDRINFLLQKIKETQAKPQSEENADLEFSLQSKL